MPQSSSSLYNTFYLIATPERLTRLSSISIEKGQSPIDLLEKSLFSFFHLKRYLAPFKSSSAYEKSTKENKTSTPQPNISKKVIQKEKTEIKNIIYGEKYWPLFSYLSPDQFWE